MAMKDNGTTALQLHHWALHFVNLGNNKYIAY